MDGQCVPLISIPEPLPEQTSGVAYVTIRGSAPTSMFIAKIWDGNRWIDPKYMSPELIEPPGPWSVQYILGVSGTAKFGLFERGEENGQNPVWTTEVTVVPYENKVIVARNEELRFPESRP